MLIISTVSHTGLSQKSITNAVMKQQHTSWLDLKEDNLFTELMQTGHCLLQHHINSNATFTECV